MRIADGLHLVASGATGFDLSHALDCNVFLVTDGSEHHLFDAGAGEDVDGLIATLRRDGLEPSGLRTLVLTHGHADHSGGAAALVAEIPGLRVVAGPRTAAILAAKDERLISLDRARGRAYPLDFRWTPPAADQVVEDGAAISAGSFRFTAVATPGHSDDHVSWLVEGGGLTHWCPGMRCSPTAGSSCRTSRIAACRSRWRRSASWPGSTSAFLPGHGRFSLRDGKRHVLAAKRFADAGLPPPQL